MIFFSCWATYIQIFFGKIHNIVTTTVTNSTNVEPVSYIYVIKPTGCQNNPGRVFPLDASASIPVLVPVINLSSRPLRTYWLRSTYSNSWIDHLLMQAPMKVIHFSYNCKRFTLVYGTHRRLWWRINLYAPDLANWVIIGSCTHTWSLVRPLTITWTGENPQQQSSVQFGGNAVVYRNKWFWNCRPHNALFLFQHEPVKSVAWTIYGNDSEANFPVSEI